MLSIWAGRLSVAFLFTRLAGESHKSRLGNMLVGLQACLAVICLLVMALRQNTSQPWEYTGSTTARWIVTGIISILADLTVAAASINLVWDLEMQAKSKWLVITAFTMRMFVLPVTIIRLVSLNGVRYSDLSFSYNLPESLIQLEMYCSLVATTLPCLRLFLTAWNTSFMNVGLQVIDPQAYSERKQSSSPSHTLSFKCSLRLPHRRYLAQRPEQPRIYEPIACAQAIDVFELEVTDRPWEVQGVCRDWQ